MSVEFFLGAAPEPISPDAEMRALGKIGTPGVVIPFGTKLRDVERMVFFRTLDACGGNKTLTARILGISRRSVYNKIEFYARPERAERGGRR